LWPCLQERIDQLAAANAALQQERTALAGQVQQLQAVGQELSGSCRGLEARLQSADKERQGLQVGPSRLAGNCQASKKACMLASHVVMHMGNVVVARKCLQRS